MRIWPAAALLAAAILGAWKPASAQLIEQSVEQHRNDVGEIDRRGDQFVHRQSGYAFPGTLGELPARKTYTYGPGDASLYYTLYGGANGDAWLSLYVYPATRSVGDEVAAVEQALGERMPGTVVSPPGLPPAPAAAFEKWYDASADGQPVVTGYRLVRDGSWYIKVRLSIPKAGGQAAIERGWNALAAVPWSVPRTSTTALVRSRLRNG